jgi:hypothetical protein
LNFQTNAKQFSPFSQTKKQTQSKYKINKNLNIEKAKIRKKTSEKKKIVSLCFSNFVQFI